MRLRGFKACGLQSKMPGDQYQSRANVRQGLTVTAVKSNHFTTLYALFENNNH